MRSIAVIARVLLVATFFAYGVSAPIASADGVFDFTDQTKSTVAAAKIEPKSVPEIKRRTVSITQTITTKDVTALRQRLVEVQAEHASLYTGNELIALIEQTEQAVVDRKAALVEKQKEFDAKLASIRAQLEELRETAAAVGADVSLEIMVTAAKNSKGAKGRPVVKPPVSTAKPSVFGPSFDFDPLPSKSIDQF